MEFVLCGWPEDEPTLRLDHERFSYAGKFVVPATGKATVRDGEVLAAAAFDADRTDPDTLVVRYLTVRTDRQGEGIGPRLLRFVAGRARERGYERVRIAVNNPFAYEASYRAGFAFTGEETGLAELVCLYPAERDPEAYRAGLERYRDRDLSPAETAFLSDRVGADPPPVVPDPGRSGSGSRTGTGAGAGDS